MVAISYFERLVETAEMISRHADYPGKSRVVAQCCQEVEDLALCGRITEDQSEMLLGILGFEPGERARSTTVRRVSFAAQASESDPG